MGAEWSQGFGGIFLGLTFGGVVCIILVEESMYEANSSPNGKPRRAQFSGVSFEHFCAGLLITFHVDVKPFADEVRGDSCCDIQ